MAIIRVLCLAYSRREGGYCFAGLNMDSGLWVRPINSTGTGALYAHQCFVETEAGVLRDPEILDIIEIEVLAPSPKLAQPENWIIGNKTWKLVGKGCQQWLASHISADPEIFRGYDKFVSASDIHARPPQCSLVLVSPQNLRWYANKTHYGKRRMDGTFSISNQSYTFPLTDERYTARLSDIALYSSSKHDSAIPLLFTISLSDEWKEQHRHYKLIAGVVE